MNLPIKLPIRLELIVEDAARFQALSTEEKLREIEETNAFYDWLVEGTGMKEELDRLASEEKERERQAIKEFIARHSN